MNIKIHITTEIFDRNGKLRYRRKRRSKSFVKAFLAILLAQMHSSIHITGIADTGGTDRNIDAKENAFYLEAASGTTSIGVVVGTDATAVIATDYKLGTQIAHGGTSGKLAHSAVSFGSLSVSDPNVSFTVQRDFTNLSGAAITVYEEGLYVAATDDGAVVRYFCAVRDVESVGVEVADGENLRVTYTIQTYT